MYSRETLLSNWLSSLFPKKTLSIQPLAGDASFRRYFRCYHPEGTYIIMDAPPEKENNCQPFMLIAQALKNHKVNTPSILHSDLEQGFLLLDDFGDTTYYQAFKTENPHQLYQQAIQTLIQLQSCQEIPHYEIPVFDAEFMLMELERFDNWFLTQLLELSLSRSEQQILNEAYERIIQSALSQSQRLIHRDYHSRNLMLINGNSIGVLDFQDAMIGPITYDLVSLLKDCYIRWPDHVLNVWVDAYFNQAKEAGFLDNQMTETQFAHAFDLMGIQRHLKVIGIFSRLHLRDNKSSYLNDIPRIMRYLLDATGRYEEFEPLQWLINTIILPKFLYPKSSFHHEMTPRTTVASLSNVHPASEFL